MNQYRGLKSVKFSCKEAKFYQEVLIEGCQEGGVNLLPVEATLWRLIGSLGGTNPTIIGASTVGSR